MAALKNASRACRRSAIRGAMGDLVGNLASEIIGIAVTVFLIDRIIEAREKRSWRPAKRVIHRRVLIGIIDPFLEKSARIRQDMDNSEYWNRFGSDIEAAGELRGATRRSADARKSYEAYQAEISAQNSPGALLERALRETPPDRSGLTGTSDKQVADVISKILGG
jgi:hypothetical protein